MNNHSNYTPSQIAVSVIFLIWFFGSILAMIFFAKNEMGYLAIGAFGQIFLVIGIFVTVSGIKNKNFNPIFLLFPIVGLGAVIVSVISQFGTEAVLDALEDSVPYLLLGVFFIAGLIMTGMALSRYFGPKIRCKDCVVGTCVELLERYDARGRLFVCPVYEVSYGMHKLKLCNEVYVRNIGGAPVINVGTQKELYINPDNPTEFVNEKENGQIAFILGVLGLLFIVISVMGIYLMSIQ